MSTGGHLPQHLLTEMTWARATTVVDDTGAAAKTWTTTTIVGRIGRGRSREDVAGGREASIAVATLYTNTAGIATTDRVIEADGTTWEVAGVGYRVTGATPDTAHYQIPLGRVDG